MQHNYSVISNSNIYSILVLLLLLLLLLRNSPTYQTVRLVLFGTDAVGSLNGLEGFQVLNKKCKNTTTVNSLILDTSTGIKLSPSLGSQLTHTGDHVLNPVAG